jgi:hypothetical protein
MHIAKGDRIRIAQGCLAQFVLSIDNETAPGIAALFGVSSGTIVVTAEENDLPASQDNLWVCHIPPPRSCPSPAMTAVSANPTSANDQH